MFARFGICNGSRVVHNTLEDTNSRLVLGGVVAETDAEDTVKLGWTVGDTADDSATNSPEEPSTLTYQNSQIV